MRLRRAVITAVAVAGIAVPVVSTAAVASAGSSPAPISATKSKPTKKPVRFEASGAVTGVNAATRVVTLQSKAKGKKTVVTEVTVAANASIVVNGVRTSLAAVGPSQWIVVTGTRTGSVFTAAKLVVKGKRSGVTPRPTPTPTPSATPTTTPSPSSSPSDGEHSEDPDDDHGYHASPLQ